MSWGETKIDGRRRLHVATSFPTPVLYRVSHREEDSALLESSVPSRAAERSVTRNMDSVSRVRLTNMSTPPGTIYMTLKIGPST